MKRTGWLLTAGLLVAGTGVAGQVFPGQPPGGRAPFPNRPMTRPPEPIPAPTDPQRRPTFRTRTELVEVAFIVTDKDGRFVGDLKPDEVTLFEDGARQEIAGFTRVDIPVGPPAPSSPSSSPTSAAQAGEASAPAEVPRDVASSELPADSRIFVLVLDALHTSPRRTRVVRDQARRFLLQHIGPSDLVAIVVPGGRSDLVLGFTRDRAQLLESIDQFQGNKLQSATVERDVDARFGGGSALRDGRDPSDGERAWRARASMDTLAQVARLLSGVQQRRKSVLFFSEGIDYNVADVMGAVQRYASEVTKTVTSAISAATRANVTFYAIDPRGLASAEGDQVESPIYATRPKVDLREPGVYGEFGESIRSLRALAEGTGGFAAVDTNTFTAAFDRILRENSAYYVAGYLPSRPMKDDGRTVEFRKIDVRVARRDVTVVARKGYLPPPEPSDLTLDGKPAQISPELSRLLASPLPDPGLPIRLQVVPFKSADTSASATAAPGAAAATTAHADKATAPAQTAGATRPAGPRTSVQLVVEIPGDALTFAEQDQRFAENVELAMVTVDTQGHGANGVATTLGLRLTAEQHSRAQLTGVRWLSRLELEPGRHQVRVAARAIGSTKRGLAIAEVDVPRFDEGTFGLSGVTLTSLPAVLMITSGGASGLRKLPTPPTAARQFVAGDRVTAVVEVYAPAAAARAAGASASTSAPAAASAVAASASALEVTAHVETAAGASKLKATQRVSGDAGRSGREEVAFAFGTDALSPGPYILRIVGRASSSSAEPVERRVPFEIVAR